MQTSYPEKSITQSGMEYRLIEECNYNFIDEDCEPKDLSMKSEKKIKSIPPPLDLTVSTFKEFVNISPSPKSPFIQKNLPFRKRAHSCPNIEDTCVPVSTPTEKDFFLPSLEEESPPPLDYSPFQENCTAPEISGETSLTDNVISHSSGTYDLIRNVESTNIFRSHLVNSPPHSASPVYLSSVLLSPALSAHGSSPELSSISAAGIANCVWHCFQNGTLIKFETTKGSSGGSWLLAEELARLKLSLDCVEYLKLENVDAVDVSNSHPSRLLCFYFICLEEENGSYKQIGELMAQCQEYHLFYVKYKGWCSACQEQVSQYNVQGIHCQLIKCGDLVLPSLKFSSDICEKFKRFSFPPDEVLTPSSPLSSPQLCDMILSPPISPTKKPSSTDKPKRPMNAFMLFAKKYRLDLIQMHPGKDNRGISILLGEAWRNLSPTEKETYVTEAKQMAEEQKRLHPDCWKRKRSHSTS